MRILSPNPLIGCWKVPRSHAAFIGPAALPPILHVVVLGRLHGNGVWWKKCRQVAPSMQDHLPHCGICPPGGTCHDHHSGTDHCRRRVSGVGSAASRGHLQAWNISGPFRAMCIRAAQCQSWAPLLSPCFGHCNGSSLSGVYSEDGACIPMKVSQTILL